MIIYGEYKNQPFFIQPIAHENNLNLAMDFIIEYSIKYNIKLTLKAITKDFIYYLYKYHQYEFEYIEKRDNFDYIYEGENLKTLVGKKIRKKETI